MRKREILKMQEHEFLQYIIGIICDYAKTNDYAITDTVKTMGENLIAITEIANFDSWEITEERKRND